MKQVGNDFYVTAQRVFFYLLLLRLFIAPLASVSS
jgi:hypothetical protein